MSGCYFGYLLRIENCAIRNKRVVGEAGSAVSTSAMLSETSSVTEFEVDSTNSSRVVVVSFPATVAASSKTKSPETSAGGEAKTLPSEMEIQSGASVIV